MLSIQDADHSKPNSLVIALCTIPRIHKRQCGSAADASRLFIENWGMKTFLEGFLWEGVSETGLKVCRIGIFLSELCYLALDERALRLRPSICLVRPNYDFLS